MIHGHPADQRALRALQTDVSQTLRGGQMDGAVIHGGGGAVGQQAVDQRAIGRRGELHVGVARLERERVLLQPELERLIQGPPQLRPLRRVDVQIHESGQQIAVFAQHAQGTRGGMARRRRAPVGRVHVDARPR